MVQIEQILKKLEEDNTSVYIDRIIEGKNFYFIYLTDQFGNTFDSTPLCYDKQSGVEVDLGIDFDASGVLLSIPERFRTYKSIIFDRLSNELGTGDLEDFTTWQLQVVINAFFLEYAWDVELEQLYALCNCFVNLVALSCEKEERENVFKLWENPLVNNYFKVPQEEQLKIANEYKYIPEFMRTFIDIADDIFGMALIYFKTGELNKRKLKKIKDTYQTQLNQVSNGLEQLNDPIADLSWLQNKKAWIEQQVNTEILFCEQKSTQISQRMEQEVARIHRENQKIPTLHPDTSFLKRQVTFGKEE